MSCTHAQHLKPHHYLADDRWPRRTLYTCQGCAQHEQPGGRDCSTWLASWIVDVYWLVYHAGVHLNCIQLPLLSVAPALNSIVCSQTANLNKRNTLLPNAA